jgi:hypothetical protein
VIGPGSCRRYGPGRRDRIRRTWWTCWSDRGYRTRRGCWPDGPDRPDRTCWPARPCRPVRSDLAGRLEPLGHLQSERHGRLQRVVLHQSGGPIRPPGGRGGRQREVPIPAPEPRADPVLTPIRRGSRTKPPSTQPCRKLTMRVRGPGDVPETLSIFPASITDRCIAEFGGVDHGPIPSLRDADHPANALFGTINKTLVNKRFSWLCLCR